VTGKPEVRLRRWEGWIRIETKITGFSESPYDYMNRQEPVGSMEDGSEELPRSNRLRPKCTPRVIRPQETRFHSAAFGRVSLELGTSSLSARRFRFSSENGHPQVDRDIGDLTQIQIVTLRWLPTPRLLYRRIPFPSKHLINSAPNYLRISAR
jgi:hypothetical protein